MKKEIFTTDLFITVDKDLSELKHESKECNQLRFAVFQANVYIFTIAVALNGMLYVFATHPITEEIGGNRNGLIVKSDLCSKLIEWLILRLVKIRRRFIHNAIFNSS